MSAEQAQRDYDASAATYGDYSTLPSGILEAQLVAIALGDCTGLKVLDLGGGSGTHARQAIGLGAALVDVVDISTGMLAVGQAMEEAAEGQGDAHPGVAERRGRIRYLHGDVAAPLSDDLGLLGPGSYDVVMGNWIFSFADSLAMVESILANITRYLRPGGRFVCVRDADPWSPALSASAKYGGSCHDVRRMAGGVRYRCVLHCSPPVEFEGACLEEIYSGRTALFEKAGLRDVREVPFESAEVVKTDRDFWTLFLEHPNLAVIHAIMAGPENRERRAVGC